MADLVMTVDSATARHEGDRVVVQISGEQANSRDSIYTDSSKHGDTADVYVRVRTASGMGTQITGPFSITASIDGAADVKTVKVHARNGAKSVPVR